MKRSNFIYMAIGLILGIGLTARLINKAFLNKNREINKLMGIVQLFNVWLKNKQEGGKIEKYFLENQYRTIAIYGMGYVGECLLNEFLDSEVSIQYIIDRQAPAINLGVRAVTPEQVLEPVDAIIVTTIMDFEIVRDLLGKKLDCPIISIEDIIYNF